MTKISDWDFFSVHGLVGMRNAWNLATMQSTERATLGGVGDWNRFQSYFGDFFLPHCIGPFLGLTGEKTHTGLNLGGEKIRTTPRST